MWPESGQLTFNGQPYGQARHELQRHLCYLGHDNALSPDLSVTENIHHLVGLHRPVRADDVQHALSQCGLEGLATRFVRTLSAGQKRRVSLARLVLAESLPLWILDEPYTHLDVHGIEWVLELIGSHAKRGGIVVFSAHSELPFKPHGYRVVNL
jgi:heme exporter protein A